MHDVLKNELSAGVLPCGRFGANAAWLRLAILTHNVLTALKRLALPVELLQALRVIRYLPKRGKRMKFARVLGMLAVGLTLWAADPIVGTWKLNPARSKTSAGPAPRSGTITYEETAGGIKRTGQIVDADGNITAAFEYTARYDGKDYPVTGSDLYDTIAVNRIDEHTAEATMKKSGKVAATARRVLSADGKTLTITVDGTNAKGEKVKSLSVYEKE